MFNCTIIFVVSDTRTPSKSNADTFDSAGHDLKELINKYNAIESAKVVEYDCVTDDVDKIQVFLNTLLTYS